MSLDFFSATGSYDCKECLEPDMAFGRSDFSVGRREKIFRVYVAWSRSKCSMALSKEFVAHVRGRLGSEPGISLARLAKELNAAEAHVITALPVTMRKKAKPEDFAAIWAWLKEHQTELPQNPFVKEELGSIWFVSQPENTTVPHSVQFFDKKGERLATVCLSKSGDGAAYSSLCEQFGVTPVPQRRCTGCGNCSCGSKGKAHAHCH